MKKDDSQYATKGDLKELKKEIVEEIGALLTDMMAALDNRFNKVEADVATLKQGQLRLEHKFDRIVEQMDSLSIRTTHLEIEVSGLQAASS